MKALLVMLMMGSVALLGQPIANGQTAEPEGPVWSWLSDGSDPKMKLEVLLDHKVLFSTSFSIANQMRSAASKMLPNTAINFSFEAERPILWRGYREADVISRAKEKIECDVWMAGSDSTAIILGVSFATPDSILMNTLHVTLPTSEAKSEIAHGLLIITSPIKNQAQGTTRWSSVGRLVHYCLQVDEQVMSNIKFLP